MNEPVLRVRDLRKLAVFHDLDAMARLATRVVLLDDGRIVDQGAPARMLGQLAGAAR